MTKCLYCAKEILADDYRGHEYHERCSRLFFGSKNPPLLEYTQDDMRVLAQKILNSRRVVTGVQPKLSLKKERNPENKSEYRLTTVGLWGDFILKPQTEMYQELPELENVTMHLARVGKIRVVPHSLIRLKSGELAYITKRVDRLKDGKLHMEDMCQLTERQTEHKYKGSHEQIGKAIKIFSSNPGFDMVNYYELVLFCYLIGNSDMHLKNFSLLKNIKKEYNLCPAYDLLASTLVVKEDDEELALNLNGKKKKLKKKDFETAMSTNGINEKAIENIFAKFENIGSTWMKLIKLSFLSEEMKTNYIELINVRVKKIYSRHIQK